MNTGVGGANVRFFDMFDKTSGALMLVAVSIA